MARRAQLKERCCIRDPQSGGGPPEPPVKLLCKLRVVFRPIAELKPNAGNPRVHSRRQVEQIAASIRRFRFTIPILIDSAGNVIAGHGRLEAAVLLGLDSVPTICVDHMSEAERIAYMMADNKLAENASWDQARLATAFECLSELDLEFDLTLTGFETAEIDLLMQDCDLQKADAADEIPEVDDASPPVSRLGDRWKLGRHSPLCRDARDPNSYQHLRGRNRAQMVLTDPPYNVRIEGNVSGLGAIKHRDFAMASGEMSAVEFIGFLATVLRLLVRYSIEGSIHFLFMDWRHGFELLSAAREIYSEFKNLCVWVKDNGGMGSLYRSRHELVFVFKAGKPPHANNVELGRHGRNRTNVWEYPGVNSFRRGRLAELAMHPTCKPVGLVADAILDCSKRGGIVLDCFGGSGTTLIAAEKTGRRGYLIELDPVFVDVTIRRFEKLTGERAIHVQFGRAFAELAQERSDSVSSPENPGLRKEEQTSAK